MELKKCNKLEDLGLFFCIQRVENSKVITEDIIKNGSNNLVTSENLDLYIEKRY